ncbi:MAG: agmatinase [Armatimonadetes bacterium]|nr:agmatinase [Armatimonadota bacterium]
MEFQAHNAENRDIFFGSTLSGESCRGILVGIPYEGRVNSRKGANLGPQGIREGSQCMESFSLQARKDLFQFGLQDLGDLSLSPGDPQSVLTGVEGDVRALVDRHSQSSPPQKLVFLGGDHCVTLPVVRAIHSRYSDLNLVHLDAHFDLQDHYLEESFSHAGVIRRISEFLPPGRIHQFGIRAGTEEEVRFFQKHGSVFSDPGTAFEEALAALVDRLQGCPVYVTIDIDVLDPSAAPGTGNPEICGLTVSELVEGLLALSPLQIAGFDLVEVSPPLDPSGRTAITAAQIIRECVLHWWG